jgi:adenylate cyclase
MTTKEKSPSRTTAFDPQAVPDAESIQQQANRILTSPEFKATDVQKSFFTFVVETALAGRSHEIKGYTVATQVFGRGEDFNQATDPIVSIQANKLRRALERYYLVAGQNDPIRIEIPKGTYVPLFRETATERGRSHSKKDERPMPPVPMRGRRSWFSRSRT